MIQLERAAEGDEFKDREAFVTQAYRDQMAEVRRAEEEEKRREGRSHFRHHLPCSDRLIFLRTTEQDWL